jgi:transglutaminase/protease-like cytokinesis protein 3
VNAGMKIQPGKFTNTWNAVLIDGEWRFVQCNWGARHLVMSKDKRYETTTIVNSTETTTKLTPVKPTRDKIKYQYDEHYFLPDPEEFILEFFPYNNEWQLLENPITLDEFESLPFVRSLFFHYHLDFVNQRQAVILTSQRGACDIKLRMPEDLKDRLAFHFHLRLAQKDDTELNGMLNLLKL